MSIQEKILEVLQVRKKLKSSEIFDLMDGRQSIDSVRASLSSMKKAGRLKKEINQKVHFWSLTSKTEIEKIREKRDSTPCGFFFSRQDSVRERISCVLPGRTILISSLCGRNSVGGTWQDFVRRGYLKEISGRKVEVLKFLGPESLEFSTANFLRGQEILNSNLGDIIVQTNKS